MKPTAKLSYTLATAGLGLALAAAPLGTALATEAGTQPATPAATEEAAAATTASALESARVLTLSDEGITLDGAPVTSDVAGVFTSHDVVYYEDRDTYESGHAYGEGSADERHNAEDAAAVTVVNITEPGTYVLSGTLSAGQIAVDLGEDAFTDPSAVVTLVLDGVDITCDVAPAVVFYNVYECDNAWSTETASPQVDTSAAGANVVIADGSVNNVTGSHVARIYKDGGEEKKLWKIDAAFYSYMSMNIDGGELGDGVLNINADNEGLDTELHLTVNGGHVNIFSGDDGINTNEDGVSVTTFNGGTVHILAGLGAEGDGVDSNGWLVINGGTVVAMANPGADAGLDSDMGSYINGGTVIALGSTMDWAESDSEQVTMNLQFAANKDAGDAIVLTDVEGNYVFAYDPSEDEVAGARIRSFMGAILSCPQLQVGGAYQLYIGGTITGDEVQGMYDVSTITAYEGGTLQSYTGTDVQGFGGFGGPGMMGGFDRGDMMGDRGGRGQMGAMSENMTPPEGWTEGVQGERPEMPEGWTEGMEPPAMPEGEAGAMPEDMTPPEGWAEGTEPPALPEGMEDMQAGQMPSGGFGGMMGAGGGTDLNDAGANTIFYAQDKVNNYSGIANAAVE